MIDSKTLPVLNKLVGELTTDLVRIDEQINRIQMSQGKGHDTKKLVRLDVERTKILNRLRRAEHLQEVALASPH